MEGRSRKSFGAPTTLSFARAGVRETLYYYHYDYYASSRCTPEDFTLVVHEYLYMYVRTWLLWLVASRRAAPEPSEDETQIKHKIIIIIIIVINTNAVVLRFRFARQTQPRRPRAAGSR